MAQVLVIAETATAGQALAAELRQAPHPHMVTIATSTEQVLRALAGDGVEAIVLDYRMADAESLGCLRALRTQQPSVPVVLSGPRPGPGDPRPIRLAQVVREACARRGIDGANARLAKGIFVGRERELEMLQAAIDGACSGNGRAVVLTGDAGIGKTTLVQAALALGQQHGMRALSGRCHDAGAASPFWPWIRMLRDHFERDAGEPWEPPLAAAQALAAVQFPAAERDVFAMCDGVATLLRQAARQHPLFISLDDLHWADGPSLLLLRLLTHEIGDCRLLIVGSYRESEVAGGPAWLDLHCHPSLTRLHLRGLAAPDVRRLLAAIADHDVSDAFADAIHQRTEGNPLFVQEFIRHLADEGWIYHDREEWRCDLDAMRLPIPDSVRAVIEQRLAHQTAAVRALLQQAAALGREFSRAILTRATDIGFAEVVVGLQQAVRDRILREIPGPDRRYRFSHSLLHEVLDDQLPDALRAAVLARLGDAPRPGAPPQTALFRLEGEYWTLEYDGCVLRLRNTKGVRYLVCLLQNPSQALSALAVASAGQRDGAPCVGVAHLAGIAAEPTLDARALREIARRRGELKEELADAESLNDRGQVERIRREIEQIDDAVLRDRGLGSTRRMPTATERARQTVTKGVRSAVGRIARQHHGLGRHLDDAITTGHLCKYEPDARDAIAWQF